MATIALNFKTNAKETDRDMMSLGDSIAAVGSIATKAFAAAAGGAALLGGAIVALSLNAAKNQKELSNMARLAGLGAREFEVLAFAAEKFDITAEQLADISKDVTEKLGEFAAVGTGGFQDFADIMKISKNDAQTLAKVLGAMPAPEALIEITKMLEGAGVGRAQTSFVLESLGSDLTKLIPLLKDNGKEWKALSSEFEKATSKFVLDPKMSNDLLDLSGSFGLLSATASSVSDFFAANFAPAITEAINGITASLGEGGFKTTMQEATVEIVKFGIFALEALSPVVSIVQLLLDGLNNMATQFSATVALASGFAGALAAGSSFGEAIDIAGDLNQATLDRGIEREEAIQGAGDFAQSGLEGLKGILESLQVTIEKTNLQQQAPESSVVVSVVEKIERGLQSTAISNQKASQNLRAVKP